MEKYSALIGMHNALEIYEALCKPLCREYDIPQTALNILVFLNANPQGCVAKEIVTTIGLSPSLVSMNVERLVREGYILREPFEEDRRKICLKCTAKAYPLVQQEAEIRERFRKFAFTDITQENRILFYETLKQICSNLARGKEELECQ